MIEPWKYDGEGEVWIEGRPYITLNPPSVRAQYSGETTEEMHKIGHMIATVPELLAMLKAANHALYVIGKPSAVKAALAGSLDLIKRAENR